jgi:hypothetical protein
MKILVFGFGASPIFFEAIVEKIKRENTNVEFSIIISRSNHLKAMKNLIGNDNVLCLNQELPKLKNKNVELSDLKNYPDCIHKNIESNKFNIKKKPSDIQMRISYLKYFLIKKFILKTQPNHILYLQPAEDMEGMIIANLAKELNISLAVPHHTRHIGLSFFSSNIHEVLPAKRTINQQNIEDAKNFLKKFRSSYIPAFPKTEIDTKFRYIPVKKLAIIKRLIKAGRRFFIETESREMADLKISLLNNFTIYRDLIRNMRRSYSRKYFNLETTSKLPEKFIFYPMQYSPESSINIPAPYFVDQLRVIDAIRMSMPSDYQLVVKEHPEAIRTRPPHFMKSLLFKSGVVVAKFDLDTEELIKKSQLVISVTGSAAFEAFLYGKPSLVLAQTFFSDFLGGICSIDDLYTKIPNTITKKITDEMIINSLSHVYSVSSEFLARSPGPHSLTMMTYENVDLFWNAFMMHKKRQDEKS